MKNFSITLIATLILYGFSSCEKTEESIAMYNGKVVNANTDEPFEGVDVKVTNGDKTHASTKTLEDGTFSLEVRLAEINQEYYILVGNTHIGTKKVDIPAFGDGSYNVGTISIVGPIETPTVKTSLVRVDNKNLLYCEGDVIESGEANVTDKGICWGTSTPTIDNGTVVSCGGGKGGYSCSVEVPNVHIKNYYVRAYATNKYGTSYGETIMIDHKNPYNLYKLEDQNLSYLVLPYDLVGGELGDINNTGDDSKKILENNSAYQLCANLVAYDYSDWELPSIQLLQLIYEKKNEIGGFDNTWYGSSSYWGSDGSKYINNYVAYDYYWINFGTGKRSHGCGIVNVRPIRRY